MKFSVLVLKVCKEFIDDNLGRAEGANNLLRLKMIREKAVKSFGTDIQIIHDLLEEDEYKVVKEILLTQPETVKKALEYYNALLMMEAE